jgi:hypothetical protein
LVQWKMCACNKKSCLKILMHLVLLYRVLALRDMRCVPILSYLKFLRLYGDQELMKENTALKDRVQSLESYRTNVGKLQREVDHLKTALQNAESSRAALEARVWSLTAVLHP